MRVLRKGVFATTFLVLFTLLTSSMASAATISSLTATTVDDFDGAGLTSLIDGTADLKASLGVTFEGDINPDLFFGTIESRVYWDSGLDDTMGTADDKTHVLYIIELDEESELPLREFDVTDSQVAQSLLIGEVIQSGDLDSLADSADPPTLIGPTIDSIDTFEGAFNSIGFNWEDANGFVEGGDAVAVYLSYDGLRDWSVVDARIKDTQNISDFESVLSVTNVPEPTTILLLGAGLVSVARMGRKRNKANDKD